MFKLSNVKYLFLIAVVGWFMAPVLNALGVPNEHKICDVSGIIQGVSWYSLIMFTIFTNTVFIKERRMFYAKIFGTGRYHYAFTVALIPCVIYAIVYEYYTYAWVCSSMFIMMEYARTVQNTYADEYHDMKVKQEIAELNE